jgi:endonuclease/exonuclease/phosphatase family metal-dependent hydrolase
MDMDGDDRLRAMSFNVRVDTAEDGADAWPERVGKVESVVRLHAPAVVGGQEALAHQYEALCDRLSTYEWYGVGRRADGSGERVPIGYRTDRFDRLERGTFWLSERPEEAGSVGWDASLPRTATWVRLRERASERRLLCCNVHLDHEGSRARAASARLLAGRLPEIADGDPVVLLGDFNCAPDSDPYDQLTEQFHDAKAVAERPHHGPTGTFHGFGGEPRERIDYVFVDGVGVRQHATLTDRWDDGRYPSDHFPVVADLGLGPGR